MKNSQLIQAVIVNTGPSFSLAKSGGNIYCLHRSAGPRGFETDIDGDADFKA